MGEIPIIGRGAAMPRIEIYNRILEAMGEKDPNKNKKEPSRTFGTVLTYCLDKKKLRMVPKKKLSPYEKQKWKEKGYHGNFSLYWVPTKVDLNVNEEDNFLEDYSRKQTEEAVELSERKRVEAEQRKKEKKETKRLIEEWLEQLPIGSEDGGLYILEDDVADEDLPKERLERLQIEIFNHGKFIKGRQGTGELVCSYIGQTLKIEKVPNFIHHTKEYLLDVRQQYDEIKRQVREEFNNRERATEGIEEGKEIFNEREYFGGWCVTNMETIGKFWDLVEVMEKKLESLK